MKTTVTIFLTALSLLSVEAFVPQVTRSPRPVPRPRNLKPVEVVPDGVFHEGKMRLSITFYDEGLFYQRDGREQLIPLPYYLKNEYPQIDFSQLRMTSFNVNSKSFSNFAHLRFYDHNRGQLKENFLPKIEDPNVAFGDFINSTLFEDEIEDFLYVGVSGFLNINNISATFERGTPNFSFDLFEMPSLGSYVGDLRGYVQEGFDEDVFSLVMREVEKMSSVNIPEPQIPDRDRDWDWNDFRPTYPAPNPAPVPYRPPVNQRDLLYNKQFSAAIGDVGLFGGEIIVSLYSGEATISGYQVQRRNGRIDFHEMDTLVTPFQTASLRLTRGDREGLITIFFSTITKNTRPVITRGR